VGASKRTARHSLECSDWSDVEEAFERGRGGGASGEERDANFDSILRFAKKAFPHWVPAEFSDLHRHLDFIGRMIATGKGDARRVTLAPRGNAKSTLVSKIYVMWVIAHNDRIMRESGRRIGCIVLLSYELSLPIGFIIDIRRELEGNEYLAEHYPEICGQGDKWTEKHIRTKNGVHVGAQSTGKSIRGFIKEASRPDLILCDDLESMEHAQTLGQRDKAEKWLDEDVIHAGSSTVDVWVVGTLVHRDSLLARLAKGNWDESKFEAVIRWADNQDRWDEWQGKYLDKEGELGDARLLSDRLWVEAGGWLMAEAAKEGDVERIAWPLLPRFEEAWAKVVGEMPSRRMALRNSVISAINFCRNFDVEIGRGDFSEVVDYWERCVFEPIREIKGRKSNAREFFEEHKEEMLAGTMVLWPDVEPYYKLMCQKADTRRVASWYQEKQNKILASEDAVFGKNVWTFWEAPKNPGPQNMLDTIMADAEQQRAKGYKLDLVLFMALDPSMGKESKKHDPAAIGIVARMPNGRWRIVWAFIRRDKPSAMFHRLLMYQKIYHCRLVVIEANQFQELYADQIGEAARVLGEPLPYKKKKQTENKELRIMGMEPHVAAGNLEYPARIVGDGERQEAVPALQTLWEHFSCFGEKDVHDDGPDVIEMAFSGGQKWLAGVPIMPETEYIEREREPTDYERIFAEHEPAECPHCWQKLPEGANICRHCEREIPGGAKIHVEPEDPAEAEEQKRQREKAKRMDMIQKALAMKN